MSTLLFCQLHGFSTILRRIALTCVAWSLAGCTWLTGPEDPVLRIHNAGDEAIHGLEVALPESQVSFGTVPPGSTTSYHRVRGPVFSYAGMSFVSGGHRTGGWVLDWNDSPLTGKQFTYVVAMARRPDGSPHIEIITIVRD